MQRNSSGQAIEPAQTVDRLDNYKSGGRVLFIDESRRQPVLVRWPWGKPRGGDEWCKPELLVPRAEVEVGRRPQEVCGYCKGAGFISVSKDPDEIADCVCVRVR